MILYWWFMIHDSSRVVIYNLSFMILWRGFDMRHGVSDIIESYNTYHIYII
jgi:hypothetical protein